MKVLWYDEVGSSQSTEMALVTGVTIGALVMSMRSFGTAINNRFEQVEVRDDSMRLMQIRVEQERRNRKEAEEQRLEQLRYRRQQQIEQKKRETEPSAPAE